MFWGTTNKMILASIPVVFPVCLPVLPAGAQQPDVMYPDPRQAVPDSSEQVLSSGTTRYVEAAYEMQTIQQETQRELWKIAVEEGIGIANYHKILRRLDEGIPIRRALSGLAGVAAFRKASIAMDEAEQELKREILRVIEENGFTVAQWNEIRNELKELPSMTPDPMPPVPLSAASKEDLIAAVFSLDTFRVRSFDYIAQQLELREQMEIFLSERKIRDQIEENRDLRGSLKAPPDFLTLLLQTGQDEDGQQKEPAAVVPDTNMLIPEILTPLGRDFYDRFYSRWGFPEGVGGVFIRMVERSTPGRGSLMTVEVNHEILYQFRLQPGYEQIQELADAVVSALGDYLTNAEEWTRSWY